MTAADGYDRSPLAALERVGGNVISEAGESCSLEEAIQDGYRRVSDRAFLSYEAERAIADAVRRWARENTALGPCAGHGAWDTKLDFCEHAVPLDKFGGDE